MHIAAEPGGWWLTRGWVNMVQGKLRTLSKQAITACKFSNYAALHLCAINFRFNHRFHLAQLVTDVMSMR